MNFSFKLYTAPSDRSATQQKVYRVAYRQTNTIQQTCKRQQLNIVYASTSQVENQSNQENNADDQGGTQKDVNQARVVYPFKQIEQKWQAYWEENQTYRTPDEVDQSKPKYYALDMFPYPSGAGLHVGHPSGYTATDITARYKRMNGYNVLHPMGWDSFGLPAEQYAIQTGQHPEQTTSINIDRFRKQLKLLGFSYDWTREIATSKPEYYKWTQWIFTKLFEKGLAYQEEVPVNWCPELGTVLANEEVIDGVSERGGYPVVRLPMKQWMLKITDYAERLLAGLDIVDWPEPLKEMQRNWIGKSTGADVTFKLQPGPTSKLAQQQPTDEQHLNVYTTRPDTLFGVTYMVLAPEHPLLLSLATQEQYSAVESYRDKVLLKSNQERMKATDKSGVFTGSYCINPASGAKIPVWVSDYVIGGYGSGAIMAVPGHDTRDSEFAATFDLPVITVVQPKKGDEVDGVYTSPGVAVNSAGGESGLNINGLKTKEAGEKVVEWLEAQGLGKASINYKFKDWLFARQRYWGEPFPIVYRNGSDQAEVVPEDQLPVTLPPIDDFKPSGSPESPLSKLTDWVNYTDPETGDQLRRETNTMPQWAGSCWYYLRFIDPQNTSKLVNSALADYWLPVDLYVGGTEHAVLHLLYARFWHMVLYDIGVVSVPEPFQKIVNQGMILGETEYSIWQDDEGKPVNSDSPNAVKTATVKEADVYKLKGKLVLKSDHSVSVESRSHKMSKSRGNVVNPDTVVEQFGADSLRLYEMFMGPITEVKIWSTDKIQGVYRFLGKVYRIATGEISSEEPTKSQLRHIHTCIKKVTQAIEVQTYNVGISSMMEYINEVQTWKSVPLAAVSPLPLLLSPYAPHIAEELWQKLGNTTSVCLEQWPEYVEEYLVQDTMKLVVQVNGKLAEVFEASVSISESDAVAAARELEGVKEALGDKEFKRIIFLPKKGILNLVVPVPKKKKKKQKKQ